MDRKIAFRAWDLENKVMMNAIFIGLGKVYSMTKTFKPAKQLENVILMQYTGLKDKNGKEIYEGDIIQDEGKYKYKVNFANGMFECCMTPLCDWIKDCEVIGNIYENPELLTKQYEKRV